MFLFNCVTAKFLNGLYSPAVIQTVDNSLAATWVVLYFSILIYFGRMYNGTEGKSVASIEPTTKYIQRSSPYNAKVPQSYYAEMYKGAHAVEGL